MSDAATLEDVQKENAEIKTQLTEVTALLKEVRDKKPEAPNIRKGENVMASRGYSYGRLVRAMIKKAQNDSDWAADATVELGVGGKLRKETDVICGAKGSGISEFCAPMASAFMPTDWSTVGEAGAERPNGERLPGYSGALIKEVRDLFSCGLQIDSDEAERFGYGRLLKANQTRNDFIYGGALVPSAERGELIEVLRNSMALTALPGTKSVPLPPQGTVIYPRQTSIASVNAYSEGEATTATNIEFGTVSLNAKKYSGLVNVTEDLLRAASGSYSVESMLRMDIAEELGRKPDRDMIDGTGGKFIKGLVNIASILTYIASTTGNDGDTLWPEDPTIMFSQMAGRNAPVAKGVVLLMRPELWAKITTARDSQAAFLFQFTYANSGAPGTLFGVPVYLTTNIPRARRKGTGTTLDMILGVIPSEIMIGQSGVIDFAMTDSDGTNFQTGLKTIRAVTYIDCCPRHEASIGLIDTLLTVRTGS